MLVLVDRAVQSALYLTPARCSVLEGEDHDPVHAQSAAGRATVACRTPRWTARETGAGESGRTFYAHLKSLVGKEPFPVMSRTNIVRIVGTWKFWRKIEFEVSVFLDDVDVFHFR